MFIIKRKINETVVVGHIAIQILSSNCGDGEVKLGIVAPKRFEVKKIPSLVELAQRTKDRDARDLWVDDDDELENAESEVD